MTVLPRRVVLLQVLVVPMGLLGLLAGCSPSPAPTAPSSPSAPGAVDLAREEAEAFLDEYVEPDGRVVRRDQGDDTVSEGQAYGLLIAQVAGDEAAFDRIWSWTEEYLQRPDRLLAWRAEGERVVDDAPASDADVLAAWALLRQGGEYTEPGMELAEAVLENEVVEVPGVGPVLAAGPWATGDPATLNPSYWTPGIFRDLAERTGDPRWSALADTSVELAAALTEGGRLLPPDWARVDGAEIVATPAPGGEVPEVRYGPDAQRLPVWLAASCTDAARELAAELWSLLGTPQREAALGLSPAGELIEESVGALPLVASAAAADAADDEAARDRLLDRAADVDEQYPSYYQGAWVVLGRAILATDLLDPCGDS